MHAHGAAVMCQITHLRRRTYWNRADWLPGAAPSPVREPAPRSFPKVMEDHDIRRIMRADGAAARRCRKGGMDGEIEAYGHLLDVFWSPATTRRAVDYGGALDNRMRFRPGAARDPQPGGQRLRRRHRHGYGRGHGGGLALEEGLQIARRLLETGTIDFINVIRGRIDTNEGMSHVIAGMGVPAAPHLAFAGEIHAALGVPTFHAARSADIATANVAAAGGHRMVLFEAAPRSSGQVRLAAALARRREIIGIVDWLRSEIERLGVDLRCNLSPKPATSWPRDRTSW